MKKPRLVPGWKKCLTWYSQQMNLVTASILPAWLALPEEWRAAIMQHPQYIVAFASTLGLLGFVGRIIDQGPRE